MTMAVAMHASNHVVPAEERGGEDSGGIGRRTADIVHTAKEPRRFEAAPVLCDIARTLARVTPATPGAKVAVSGPWRYVGVVPGPVAVAQQRGSVIAPVMLSLRSIY